MMVSLLSACGVQLPEPDVALSTQSAAPEMRVRSVTLDDDAARWLGEVKGSRNLTSSTSRYSFTQLGGSGRVQDLSRQLNLQMTAVLAALRVTGDESLLEEVYAAMELERATLKDTDGDGYLNWIWVPGAKSAGALNYTDRHVMEEIMAHAITAQAAYAFKLNANQDAKYGEAAAFWTDYLQNHYEAKWRKRTGRGTYPVIDKPLLHPYTNNTRYYHYMYKLTGEDAYRTELERRVAVLKRHLMPDRGAVVWSHFVNEALPKRRQAWLLQPVGYTGETMSALADLGFEGVLDEGVMNAVALSLSRNMLDGKARGLLASDVGGGRAGRYHSPLLERTVRMNAPQYPRGQTGTFAGRGYALMARWDASGEIGSVAADVHRRTGASPIAPTGALLGGLR